MLTIRLQRAGKKNRPEFRIVLAEKEASAVKKITEILGHYNPRTKAFSIKQDRLQYWMSQHVTLSPTIHNLFVTQKLLESAKVKAFSIPAKKTEEPAAAGATAAAAPTSEAIAETPAESTTDPVQAELIAPAEVIPAPEATTAPESTPAEPTNP